MYHPKAQALGAKINQLLLKLG